MELVEEMTGSTSMDDTFEELGLDSLSLISLARRLSAKVGRTVSVVDLYDRPTPRRLLDSFSAAPQPSLVRPKALCLHGFRSNKDALAHSLAPFVSAVGFVEWIFVNAPRPATGPSDPKIPISEAFEWWGQRGGDFETGWMAPHYDGFDEALPSLAAIKPVGVVGFSQGGGVASVLETAWTALFSAVCAPRQQKRSTPSFHSYDDAEEHVNQCKDVASFFEDKVVHVHTSGHNIPNDPEVVRHFAAFVAGTESATTMDKEA
jgi:aryl carrier-like protein